MRNVALALFLVFAAAPAAQAQAHRGKIRWVGDFNAGLRQAKSTNKPIMLFFTASW